MSSHPKRFMRDGTATSRRVDGVTPVECTNSAHVRCFLAVTSWAGDPIPRPDERWHAYVSKSGAVCLLGPFVGFESAQFQAGIKRRVRNAIAAGI